MAYINSERDLAEPVLLTADASSHFNEVSEQLLILESRFRGLSDTVAFYDTGMLRWTSTVLSNVLQAQGAPAAADLLKRDHDLQAACLKEFRSRLTTYFESLRKESASYFDRFGLQSKGQVSVSAVVQDIVDALDINLFIPVGTYISPSKTIKGEDGKNVVTFGSFYFHSVLYADTSWSTNFLTRVSLHLSQAPLQLEFALGDEASGRGVEAKGPDYELGDFYDVRVDPYLKKKIATDLGIDVPKFKAWLAVKRAVFYKRSSGKLPADAQIESAILLYRQTLLRLYREFARCQRLQSDACNVIALMQWATAKAKSLRLHSESVPLPPVKPQLLDFSACHIAGLPAARSPGSAEEIQQFLDSLTALLTAPDASKVPVQQLDSFTSSLLYQLDVQTKVIASYKEHLTELLTQLELFSEELNLADLSVHRVIDAFLNLFGAVHEIFPRLARVLLAQEGKLHALLTPNGAAISAPAYSLYWQTQMLTEVDPESHVALATSLVTLWERFSSLSLSSLNDLRKKLEYSS